MKNQKGITLVALIITIIVMLILVAVTISVALNGGIFTKAREANLGTKVAQVKEAIALAKTDALSDYYGKLETSGNYTTPEELDNYINSYLQGTGITVTTEYVSNNSFRIKKIDGDTEVSKYFLVDNVDTEATISFGTTKLATD